MKTREEWKTTIDEIAALKDKFMQIKTDALDLIMSAKKIALSIRGEADEFMMMAKENGDSLVKNVLNFDLENFVTRETKDVGDSAEMKSPKLKSSKKNSKAIQANDLNSIN